VRTPPLKGTILPGITRNTALQLLRDGGHNVLEEEISVEEACEADEVFTTGTAVVVASVGSLTYKGMRS
jgi:branched-chain amino acid aminotransferase